VHAPTDKKKVYPETGKERILIEEKPPFQKYCKSTSKNKGGTQRTSYKIYPPYQTKTKIKKTQSDRTITFSRGKRDAPNGKWEQGGGTYLLLRKPQVRCGY